MSYAVSVSKHKNDSDEELPPLPCHRCRGVYLRAILAQYGGMCTGCYERYCQERSLVPHVADKRADGPRAWAYALQAREQSGERLTGAQKAMWRAVVPQPVEAA